MSDETMHKATVLVVDDEPANLAILSQVLEPHCQVLAASSGERALRLLAHTSPPPDLILLDIMMPNMDGYDVLRALRASPATADIAVIFVTALNDDLDEEHGLGLGAADYINKPIKPRVVLARVRTQLELKAARDGLRRQNQWLEQEVAGRLREIELIQDVSLTALAELAETRDNETGHHIQRTQSYMSLLTDTLVASGYESLDAHRAELFIKAAPLHDIGKVGIPDSILLKPGRLSREEFELMKTHAAIGAAAIDHALQRAVEVHTDLSDEHGRHALAFLEAARDIALCHHEHWDGGGYPRGLAREAIPLSGRLMALADVFDALISPRVYKPAMPAVQARQIILEGRGTQFDPAVVEVFEARFADFVAIAERYKDVPGGP